MADSSVRVLKERYELRAEIGRGGMAVVHRGWDRSLERDVAVKLVSEEGQSERFLAEARRTAQIRHAAVVEVFDVGADNADAFLVMELLEGESLESVLKREQRLAPERAIGIAIQICDALGASHALGVVHRDVKPGNVFVTKDGRVKVLDFGVAKRVDSATLRTEPGVLVGTLRYMAPEQIRGEELDGRADLYSVGVMLHRMLSGSMPFEAENMAQVLHAHLELAPRRLEPLLGLDEQVRAGLDSVIQRLLAKSPQDRYADAASARRALEGVRPERMAQETRASAEPPAIAATVAMPLLDLEPSRPERPLVFEAPTEAASFEIDAQLPPSHPAAWPAWPASRAEPGHVAMAMPVMNTPERFAPPPPPPDTWAGLPTSVSKRVAAYPALTLAVYAFLFRINLIIAVLLVSLSIFGLVAYIQVKRQER